MQTKKTIQGGVEKDNETLFTMTERVLRTSTQYPPSNSIYNVKLRSTNKLIVLIWFEDRVKENLQFASASTFNRTFNIVSRPEDQCGLCESHTDEAGKQKKIEVYEKHLKQK